MTAKPKDKKPKSPKTKMVPLSEPLVSGDTEITELTLQKPGPGAFRGLSMLDISRMQVDSFAVFLPRITSPSISEAQVWTMEIEDLTQCMQEVDGWLAGN